MLNGRFNEGNSLIVPKYSTGYRVLVSSMAMRHDAILDFFCRFIKWIDVCMRVLKLDHVLFIILNERVSDGYILS